MNRQEILKGLQEAGMLRSQLRQAEKWSDKKLHDTAVKFGVIKTEMSDSQKELIELLKRVRTIKARLKVLCDDSFDGDIMGAIVGLYADEDCSEEIRTLSAELDELRKRIEKNEHWLFTGGRVGTRKWDDGFK